MQYTDIQLKVIQLMLRDEMKRYFEKLVFYYILMGNLLQHCLFLSHFLHDNSELDKRN